MPGFEDKQHGKVYVVSVWSESHICEVAALKRADRGFTNQLLQLPGYVSLDQPPGHGRISVIPCILSGEQEKTLMRRSTILLLIGLLLLGCQDTPDEEQIAEAITTIQAAVEQKDFAAIQDHLHDGFVANEQMDAGDAKRLLAAYGMQHRKLGVTIVGSNTTMDPVFPHRAQTTLSVVVTGSSGRLPSDGSVRTIYLEWTKDSGEWLVRKAQWQHYR